MNSTNRPGLSRTIMASAARTTSSNSGNLKDTTISVPVASHNLAIHFNWTAFTVAASAPGSALNRFYVESSPDGGTTWLPAWRSTDFTTSTGDRVAYFKNGYALMEYGDELMLGQTQVGTTSARIATQYPLTRDVRVRWDIGIVGAAAVSAGVTVTFAVYASYPAEG